MHYKTFIITKEFPTDAVIEEVMRPFNGEDYYSDDNEDKIRPAFTWDWYEVGGRYNSCLKLDIEKTDEKYGWDYLKDRDNKVFRSYLFNELYRFCDKKQRWLVSEYKFYSCLGIDEGFIRVDGGLIEDMQDFDITNCCNIVDKDGNGLARDVWDGEHWSRNEHFDEQARAIFADSEGCYICTVDVHD